jgi:hypothetical protein
VAAVVAAGYTGTTMKYNLTMKPSLGRHRGPLLDEQKASMGEGIGPWIP